MPEKPNEIVITRLNEERRNWRKSHPHVIYVFRDL